MQLHTLPLNTAIVLQNITGCKVLEDFFLVGGTALALRFGHRISIDLDFFTQLEFSPTDLAEELAIPFGFTVTHQEKNTLGGFINGVKIDFIRHRYTLLEPIEEENGIRMASVKDIAANKITAICNTGSKKDFYDLFELLKMYSLQEIIDLALQKFKVLSPLIIHKSLIWFNDAEQEHDPESLNNTQWNEVKQKITASTRSLVSQ